ncbi:MAG: hypothetical protein HYX76_08610 [Acidobacteria bacterium]|nr:hypothetical protein [Acidobacteriota bacterium]
MRETRLVREQRGQTFTEYLMILGLLTAIIISLTGFVVPPMQTVTGQLVDHVAVFLTTW